MEIVTAVFVVLMFVQAVVPVFLYLKTKPVGEHAAVQLTVTDVFVRFVIIGFIGEVHI